MSDVYATSFSGTEPAAKGTLRQQAYQKAQELEAVFLNTLVKEMVSTSTSKGDFSGGYAEETWRSMQSEQFAAAMARSGGLGIADQIMTSLLGAQEAAQNPAVKAQPIQGQTYQGISS